MLCAKKALEVCGVQNGADLRTPSPVAIGKAAPCAKSLRPVKKLSRFPAFRFLRGANRTPAETGKAEGTKPTERKRGFSPFLNWETKPHFLFSHDHDRGALLLSTPPCRFPCLMRSVHGCIREALIPVYDNRTPDSNAVFSRSMAFFSMRDT